MLPFKQIGGIYTRRDGYRKKSFQEAYTILKRVGDQLSIKPVHVNPCFYWPVEDDQLFPLDRDKWHQLCSGDSFSLLVDKYTFKVLCTPLEKENLLRRPSRSNPTTLQSTIRSHSQVSEKSTILSSKKQLPEVYSLMEKTNEIPEKFTVPKKEELRPAQRKRQLPEWMVPSDLMVSTQSTSASKNGSNEEVNPGVSKKQKILESEDSALLKEGVFTKDVAKKMPRNGNKKISQKAESSFEQFNSQLDDEELDLDLKSDGQASQPAQVHSTNTKENKLEHINSKPRQIYKEKPSQSLVDQGDIQEATVGIDTSNIMKSQEMQQSSHINKPQRTACQYGKSCYRKNPIHFQQFSHPGDSDYQDLEDLTQVDDDRPECPYGTACYRKNPQHKLEYKHTAPPESERRQTRSKITRKVRSILADESDDDGEPNEYNLNDSFIDDDEEEECDPTDEDSDWEPDCQDDDEDTDMLLKEAHDFVKTKN